jgi:intracellular sulfur oxidation DsrE/DsrF family protein
MKFICLSLLLIFSGSLLAQQKVNPAVPSFGGIYPIPEATVRPDSMMRYRIVVDVRTGADAAGQPSAGLSNVARMLNLHHVGGVTKDMMEVVLAIHGDATFSVLNNAAYKRKYGINNPDLDLIRELKVAGVQLTVCGQSLKGRNIKSEDVLREIDIATSMLTTLSTCQLRGFAVFQF